MRDGSNDPHSLAYEDEHRTRRAARLPEDPDIVLFGCRPLVPDHGALYDPNRGGGPFHARPVANADVADKSWPVSEQCPACKGNVGTTFSDDRDGDVVRVCGWCHGMGEPWDRNAGRQRAVHEARVASIAAEQTIHAEAITAVAEHVELSELERRRLWNGYTRGSRLRDLPLDEVSGKSHSRLAREWLTKIGQAPDWDLILDTRGNVLGRLSEGYQPPAEWSDRAAEEAA